jgi:hypothetical protein
MKFAYKLACIASAIAISNAYAAPQAGINSMANPTAQIQNVSFLNKFFGGGQQPAQQQQQPQAAQEEAISDEAFNDKTTEYTNTKFYANAVSYKIRIPKSWENMGEDISENPDVNDRLLQTIEEFRGPTVIGGQRPTIKVEAMILKHEMLAEHWLQNYIFKNGFTLPGEIKATNESEAEADIVYVKGPLSLTAKLKVIITQNRLILIRFDAPTNLDKETYKVANKSIEEFKLIDTKIGNTEEIIEFSLSNRITFNYPNSWLIKNHVLSDANKVKTELHNVGSNGDLLGLIQIQSYRTSRKSLNDILKDLKEGIEGERKISPAELTHSSVLNVGLNFDMAMIETYKVSINDRSSTDYELWLAVLNEEGWLNTLYLLTPSKDIDYYEWARNTRAFDILLSSIK